MPVVTRWYVVRDTHVASSCQPVGDISDVKEGVDMGGNTGTR